jgi:hypothetical protein
MIFCIIPSKGLNGFTNGKSESIKGFLAKGFLAYR